MNRNEACEKILEILSEVLEEKKECPSTYDEDISERLDSIEFVMLIVEIENGFDIKVLDDDFENVNTINKLADLVFKYKEN